MSGYLEWDLGLSMLSTVDKDGFIGIQVDAYGEEDSGVEPYESLFPLGFYARPLDPSKDDTGAPDPKNACTILYAMEGGQGHAFPMGDPRLAKYLPKLKKGGAMWACPIPGAGYMLWDGRDPNGKRRAGSFTLGVRYAGKTALIAVDVGTPGEEFIRFAHGEGNSIELRADGSIVIMTKSGETWVSIKDDQIVLNGDTQAQGSMSVGDAAAAQPVVSLAGLLTYLTALETALKAAASPIVVPTPAAAMKEALGTKTLTAS